MPLWEAPETNSKKFSLEQNPSLTRLACKSLAFFLQTKKKTAGSLLVCGEKNTSGFGFWLGFDSSEQFVDFWSFILCGRALLTRKVRFSFSLKAKDLQIKLHQHRPQIEIKTLNSGSALLPLSLAQPHFLSEI